MKLRALRSQVHLTVIFLTGGITQERGEPDTGSADKVSGQIMDLLWRSGGDSDTFNFLDFASDTDTHRDTHVQGCPQDTRCQKPDKGYKV